MTEREMVKVMEVCKDKEMPCDDCPLVEYGDCEEISRQYFYDRFKQLKAENAALRERLEKSVELPARVMIERTIVNGKFKPTQKAQAFNGRIGVVYRDETRYKGLLVDICSEKVSDYEAAEARLAELKGGKKDD